MRKARGEMTEEEQRKALEDFIHAAPTIEGVRIVVVATDDKARKVIICQQRNGPPMRYMDLLSVLSRGMQGVIDSCWDLPESPVKMSEESCDRALHTVQECKQKERFQRRDNASQDS